MVLVDTSVWVTHFRQGNIQLKHLLEDGEVMCHPFIIGELACGNINNRGEILSLLNALPIALQADHNEVIQFIEKERLMGKGLGYIDVHLIVAALLSDASIWSDDRRLYDAAAKLKVAHHKK